MKQYCVLHIDKSTGGEARMTAHIERSPEDIVCHKANIDESRTHLNRSLIDYPPEVSNRTQAIEHRISTAGIKRKVSDNQVRVLRVMLSGTHERMKELEAEGRIDEWCQANIAWAKATFGADNVVSAELHMDEKTPHIHLSVVPIVKEATKRKGKDGSIKVGKEKVRLAARDVLTAAKLAKYQTTYAAAMSKFGLQRGVEGSEAEHLSKGDWMRKERQEHEAEIKQLDQARIEKKKAIDKENGNRIKAGVAAMADVVKAGSYSFANVLGKSKYAAIEAENVTLKANLQSAQTEFETFKKNISTELTEARQNAKKSQNLAETKQNSIRDFEDLLNLCVKYGIDTLNTFRDLYLRGKALYTGWLKHGEWKAYANEATLSTYGKDLLVNGTKAFSWVINNEKKQAQEQKQDIDNKPRRGQHL